MQTADGKLIVTGSRNKVLNLQKIEVLAYRHPYSITLQFQWTITWWSWVVGHLGSNRKEHTSSSALEETCWPLVRVLDYKNLTLGWYPVANLTTPLEQFSAIALGDNIFTRGWYSKEGEATVSYVSSHGLIDGTTTSWSVLREGQCLEKVSRFLEQIMDWCGAETVLRFWSLLGR